jgi:hypothetical protein
VNVRLLRCIRQPIGRVECRPWNYTTLISTFCVHLFHDSHLRSDSAKEVEAVHEMLAIADHVMAGAIDDADRTRARTLIHPSTAHLYLK